MESIEPRKRGYSAEKKELARLMYISYAFPQDSYLAAHLGISPATLRTWKKNAADAGDDWDIERERLTHGEYLGPQWDTSASVRRAMVQLQAADAIRRVCEDAIAEKQLFFKAPKPLKEGEMIEVDALYTKEGRRQIISGIKPSDFRELTGALDTASKIEERARAVLDNQQEIEQRVSSEVMRAVLEVIQILEVSPEQTGAIIAKLFPEAGDAQQQLAAAPDGVEEGEQA